ncbi:glycosyltransferase family 8 protein [Acetobacter sp.]|uniref:glycosyltransferase family 8 protein n=1 Tax=Acetobacter sp. TaxID=440 RepID=UPI0039ED15A8
MPNVCVCYTTDAGYLFPSFVSALQARWNTQADQTDILLIGVDIDPETKKVFEHICENAGIIFQTHEGADIHHAPAMLARLFLSELLPQNYDRFLYVDGDTQMRGNLDRLLHYPLPSGKFSAVTDPMCFTLGDQDPQSRDFENHFSAIGFNDQQARNYFNSGVIYAEREGWAKTGPEAWEKFQSFQAKARFPDQDVLNIVGLPHRLSMSFTWNFPIFLKNTDLEEKIRPSIYHFMSSPKPWDGNFIPWDRTASLPYEEITGLYPQLRPYWKRMDWKKRQRYHLQQRFKRWQERREWGGERERRILAYEANVDIKC